MARARTLVTPEADQTVGLRCQVCGERAATIVTPWIGMAPATRPAWRGRWCERCACRWRGCVMLAVRRSAPGADGVCEWHSWVGDDPRAASRREGFRAWREGLLTRYGRREPRWVWAVLEEAQCWAMVGGHA